MNWLKRIVGDVFGFNEEIKLLNEKIEKLSHETDEEVLNLHEQIIKLTNEINTYITQLEEANKKIDYLKTVDNLDVEELKEWYISRMGNNRWTYNWDGKGSKPVEQSFRYKDEKTGAIKLTELANTIIDRYNIVDPLPVELIERVKQYFTVRSHWTYVFDHLNPLHPGVMDYWQEIDVSIDTRRGDCEDLAILMHMLIRTLFDMFNYENYKWRLHLSAGRMLGEGGHAYNLWLHDDGNYYAIESTYDLEGNFKRAWLNTPVVNNNMYVDFWGFANPRVSRTNFSFNKNYEALKRYYLEG